MLHSELISCCIEELARDYADLIRDLWSGERSVCEPRNLKLTIASRKAAFVGSQQHDSQELIAFLLDALHDDLNRLSFNTYYV